MRIFISYSHLDRAVVDRIIDRLRGDGHDVWVDSIKLRPGDNFERKIREGLETADALIVVISENSFRSQSVQHEFSAIALRQISKGGEPRIIPVRIDSSEVPSYLSNRLYLDLSVNFEAGLEKLSLELLGTPTLESLSVRLPRAATATQSRGIQISKLREALRKGRMTLVCGAGVSVEAGVPAWGELLIRLLDSMMERISKDHSLKLGETAAAEFHKRHGASSLILGKYLKNNLGRDFQSEVRDALYSAQPTSSRLIDGIIELSRPQRDARPLDSIITFNFDCLIEERLAAQSIPNRPIFSEAIMHDSNQLPIYHVHGYLPRSGEVPQDVELVFSEDAYHGQFIDSFSWSNLIQLNKLTQNTCLFIGISLTDPNMRRLLDVAWRKNPDKNMSHYLIRRLPKFSEGDVLDEVSKLLEEQDANGLGLNVIWIEDFSELPSILREIATGDA
jgi:TIR domain/SIR2-like domain